MAISGKAQLSILRAFGTLVDLVRFESVPFALRDHFFGFAFFTADLPPEMLKH